MRAAMEERVERQCCKDSRGKGRGEEDVHSQPKSEKYGNDAFEAVVGSLTSHR